MIRCASSFTIVSMQPHTELTLVFISATLLLVGSHFSVKHSAWCTLGSSPEMARLLGETAATLYSANVSFWVTGGTALGLARSGDLLAHDDDADICVEDALPLDNLAFSEFDVTRWEKGERYATLRRGLFEVDIHICRPILWQHRDRVHPARWPAVWHASESTEAALCQYTTGHVPAYNKAFPYRCTLRQSTLPPIHREFREWVVPVPRDEHHYCESLYGAKALSQRVIKEATGVDRLVACSVSVRVWWVITALSGLAAVAPLFLRLRHAHRKGLFVARG